VTDDLAGERRLEALEDRICRVEAALQIPILIVEWLKRLFSKR